MEAAMDRPIVALVLLIIFYLLSFGLRTAVHRRRTGSSGFRGISRDAGFAGWLGGVAFVAALIAGIAAPTAELIGVIDPLIEPPIEVAPVGAALAVGGVVGTWWAQSAMGKSWRIGVSEKERTELIERGPFRWIRNPIFSFMMLTAFGLAILLPNVLSVSAFLLLLLGVELQVRFVEEPYLAKAHGETYRDYCRRVARFVPGFGHGLSR
jgi:protein-S-isoprenylcysteine O-methyltransferase Ste14